MTNTNCCLYLGSSLCERMLVMDRAKGSTKQICPRHVRTYSRLHAWNLFRMVSFLLCEFIEKDKNKSKVSLLFWIFFNNLCSQIVELKDMLPMAELYLDKIHLWGGPPVRALAINGARTLDGETVDIFEIYPLK